MVYIPDYSPARRFKRICSNSLTSARAGGAPAGGVWIGTMSIQECINKRQATTPDGYVASIYTTRPLIGIPRVCTSGRAGLELGSHD